MSKRIYASLIVSTIVSSILSALLLSLGWAKFSGMGLDYIFYSNSQMIGVFDVQILAWLSVLVLLLISLVLTGGTPVYKLTKLIGRRVNWLWLILGLAMATCGVAIDLIFAPQTCYGPHCVPQNPLFNPYFGLFLGLLVAGVILVNLGIFGTTIKTQVEKEKEEIP